MKTKLLLSYMLILMVIACSNRGKLLNFNNGELYFTENVSEDDATKLGNYLVENEFFDGKEKTVQLDSRNDTFVFRMVAAENIHKDKQYESYAYAFATGLSWLVFEGKAVEVHFCDKYLETVTVIKAVAFSMPDSIETKQSN